MNTQATVLKSYIALLQPTDRARKARLTLFFRWSALFVLLALAAESHAQMTVSLTPAWNAWAYNVSNYGGADGSIASDVSGGTTPFSYVWTKGSDTIGTTQNVNGLTAGLYQLIVEDSLGLRDTASVYLSQPSVLSASITPHDPCGLASNSATAYPTGAVGPYTYAWDTGDSLALVSGLDAGLHSVLITAANGDTVTAHCTIHTPLELEMSATPNSYGNHLACEGDTATLDLTVSGGVPPYTYLWESGSFSQDLQATTGGLKKVRVWDSRGCMADDSLLLVAASALNMDVQPHLYPNGQGFSCDTCNDGMFVVHQIQGGEPPYTIAWSTGATGDTLFNIIPDTTYTLTITDAQGCTLSDGGAMPRGNLQGDNSLSVVVDAPHWAGGYHVSCSTCSDAKVLLYPSGGQPPYAILWADGDTSRYRYNMAAGDYTVTIFDQMGDSLVRNVTLIGPGNELDAQISNMTTVNNGLITGGLNAMVNGGVPPYSYVWKKDGSVLMNTWSYLSVSQTGTYSLVVTDATSGMDSATVVIALPEDTTTQAPAPPAWGMYGNAGNGDILEGEGTPWFGTADSTDVVMKSNGVPQLKLGANGVTSVEGQLRLAQLQEATLDTSEPQFKLMVAGDDGLLKVIDPSMFWVNMSRNRNDCFNSSMVQPLEVQGQWYSGINKLYSCPSVNVGIGTDVPQSKLDVRGDIKGYQGMLSSLKVNSPTNWGESVLTIKGIPFTGYSNSSVEIQNEYGTPVLNVFNNGKVIIGDHTGHWIENPFQFQVMPTSSNNGMLLTKSDGGYGILVGLNDRNAKGMGIQYTNGNSDEELFYINGYGDMYLRDHLSVGTLEQRGKVTISSDDNVPGLFVRTEHTGSWGGIISSVNSASTLGLSVFHGANSVFSVWGSGDAYLCGQLKSKKIVVDSDWCDYVFADEHKKHSLKEIEDFTMKNKHLPLIPAGADIECNGLEVGSVMKGQMLHIEEIYLHLIEISEELQQVKAENNRLRAEMDTIMNKK